MTAADEGQERWRDPRGEDPDLRLEGVDRSREFPDPGQQIAGEAGDRLGPRRQIRLEAVEDDRTIQRPSGRLVDPELDEEPAEPLLVTGAVDRHDGVGALVRIESNDDHVRVSLLKGWRQRTGRWTRLSGGVATLLSSHAGRSDVPDGRHYAWRPHRFGGHGAYEPTRRTQRRVTLTGV